MRTTLDIDADVLAVAKEISRSTKHTAGQVISDLARAALLSPTALTGMPPTVVNGFEVMPTGGRVVTPELLRKLVDEQH